MKIFNAIYLALGFALLGFVLFQSDFVALKSSIASVGATAFLVIAGIYFTAFFVDTLSWHLTFQNVAFTFAKLYELWKIRMFGEALNTVMPLASIGGEPVKIVLLEKNLKLKYREGIASLILARTTNLLALFLFLVVGFYLMLEADNLPFAYRLIAAAGFVAFSIAIGLFFLVQRLKLSSLAGLRISRTRLGRKIEGFLHHIHDMEDRLLHFYIQHHRRFALALGLALFNWVLGVAEVYATLYFLGHPVSFTDAWIIESMVQMIRAGTFFIPASIGAQEGVFVLLVGSLTGMPVLGLATAVIRRCRELVWVIWGFLLGGAFSLSSILSKARKIPPADLSV